MQKENYDERFRSTAEILAANFTSVMYNDLYNKAKSGVGSRPGQSLTDAYKEIVGLYSRQVVESARIYRYEIKQLHEYYQRCTTCTAIMFSDFEDGVIKQFVPAEYYRDLKSTEKDNLLGTIVKRLVRDLAVMVCTPEFLRRIIDEHQNRDHVRIMQDRIIDLLICYREDFYSSFAKENTGPSTRVDIGVVSKLKAVVHAETKKRCAAEAERDKAVDMIRQLTAKIVELQAGSAQAEPRIEYVDRIVERIVERPMTDNVYSERPAAMPEPEPLELIPAPKRGRGRPRKRPPTPPPAADSDEEVIEFNMIEE